MLILMLIVIVIIIFLLSDTLFLKNNNDPLTVLKQRLAKCEITLEEYKKAKEYT
jgi:uncharacterized membrane protein